MIEGGVVEVGDTIEIILPRIIDLASGGGLINLVKDLKMDSPNIKITLTDYYPNLKAFEKLKVDVPDTIFYEKASVDATQPPNHLHYIKIEKKILFNFTS